WQACSAVAANAPSSKAVNAEVEMFLVEGPASVSAHAAAIFRTIEGKSRTRRSQTRATSRVGKILDARIGPVTEAAVNAIDLIMAVAGLKDRLRNNVRRWVEGIIRIEGVVKTTAGAKRACHPVGGV